MAKTNFIAHPYDSAFKSLLVRGSPLITIPFINELFHPKIPLDENAVIINKANELFIAEADKNNFKVKITDALLIINGKAYHIECDCYKRNRIILNVTEYDLGSGLNNRHLSKNTSTYTCKVVIPESGVLFLRKPHKKKLIVEVMQSGHTMQYEVHPLVLADYTLEDLVQRRLYFLIPFYLFNYEKDIRKYNTDPAGRERVKNALYQMIDALDKGLEEEKILSFDYDLLTAMMRVVTEGLTKKYSEVWKELDEIMGGYVLTIPSDKYYFKGRRDGKDEGKSEGIDEGKIGVYYEEMKMSPEDIAKKMNKPLDMVQKVITELISENND